MPAEQPSDQLNSSLREFAFKKKHRKLFKDLAKKTHFNNREVEALALIHRKITELNGPITRQVFQACLHSALDFTENIRHLLVDRLHSQFDTHNALQLRLDDWIKGMSIILKGSLKERIHFAYKVYDLMKTNRLKREQIFPIMRGCLIKISPGEDLDDAVKDLIDIVVRKMDVDHDSAISEDDFTKAVTEVNELFLESFGPVFPSREAQMTFLSTLTDRLNQSYK